jgi:hypothetical protein
VAYSNSDPQETLVGPVLEDISEAIVPAMPAASLEACCANREVKVVISHQQVGRLNFKEIHNGLNRLPAVIHECSRL